MDINVTDVDIGDIALDAKTILHNRYQIDTVYYWGHTGIVYLSTDLEQNRTVVVKEYCPYYLANRDMDRLTVVCKGKTYMKSFEQARKAFAKESEIVQRMSDLEIPYEGCTLEYIDYFEENDTLYLVTELVVGKSLEEYILEGDNFSIRHVMLDLVKITRQIHKRGIVHRDIKPSNIILSDTGKVVLIDYGSACYSKEKDTEVVFVSRGFSAPELYQNTRSDFRTDIYSIGALLYYLLTDCRLPDASEMESDKDVMKVSEFIPISHFLQHFIMKSIRLKRSRRLKHLWVLQWVLSI